MNPPAETRVDIAEAAAEWVVRRDRGLSTREQAAFAAWHAVDSRHREEFARIAQGWRSLDRLAPAPELSEEADAVVRRAQQRRSRRRLTVMTGGLLAAAAALALFFFVPNGREAPVDDGGVRVIASNSREIRLPDGSIATLNGDSRIETEYTPTLRRVRLVHGEAHFTVAKNPNRPFLVAAGPVTVRAVGTAFNVRLAPAAVEVLVTEGRVRVDDSTKGNSLLPERPAAAGAGDAERVLAAGERVVVNLAAVVDESAQARVATMAPAEIELSLAWQTTQLVFDDTRLDEVVAAFNRHNRRQLVIGDAELAAHRITGRVRADNLEGFTRVLEDVRTEVGPDDQIVLRVAR